MSRCTALAYIKCDIHGSHKGSSASRQCKIQLSETILQRTGKKPRPTLAGLAMAKAKAMAECTEARARAEAVSGRYSNKHQNPPSNVVLYRRKGFHGSSPQSYCSDGRRQHCRAEGARPIAACQTEALSPFSSSGYPRTTNERSFTTVMDKHASLRS